jgi:Flp pilus assembly secretin CpaC
MTQLRLLPLFLALAGASRFVSAQTILVTPPTEERPSEALPDDDEMARLHALPASHIPLKSASLASAIRLLAQAAHMPYLAPVDDEFKERVTSDVMMNPYELLQVLADNYNFGMEYRRGIWRFYRVNLNELVTKAYTLHFNNFQQVKITSGSINGQLAALGNPGGGGGGGGQASPGGSGMGGSGGSGGGGGGGSSSIDATAGKIIEDIKGILGIDTVGLSTPSLDNSPNRPGAGADHAGQKAPAVSPIWNADTNQLFVVATRQQHSLIASYLKAVDQPQKLIRIAVKFVETQHSPSSSVGVDWSQTFLGNGGPITLSGVNAASTLVSTATAGAGGLTPISTNVSLGHIGHFQLPSALLSAPAFQWTLNAIAADTRSSIVQDPVIFTSNNHGVVFKATTQDPIQQGSTTFGTATPASTTQIAYIEVGTILNVLPSVLPGNGRHHEIVQLNLSIQVSTIVGQQVINGNSYPVTSNREYSYSVMIPTGQTLAIAGLEQRSRIVSDSKVPGLGDIPLLGYAFKDRTDSVQHNSLIAFITPEVIRSSEDEAAEANHLPDTSHRVFQGSETETLAQLKESLAGFDGDITALVAAANSQNKLAILNRLDRFGVELSLMDVRLGELRVGQDRLTAADSTRVTRAQQELDAARSTVGRIAAD